MKTFRLISILVLTLSANLVLADNDPDYLVYNPGSPSTLALSYLAPVIPNEADFNDVDLSCTIPFPANFFKTVIPSLPRYADFDDDILPVHVGKLIPALPMEANF
jgi:hypothetical protein